MKARSYLLAVLAFAAVSAHGQTVTPTPAPAPDYVAQLRAGPTASSNSPALVAAQTAQEVPVLTTQLFRVLGAMSKALWLDPTKAQAIVDSLGEKAAPLFVAYGEFTGPLAVIDPVSYAKLPPIPAGYSWTILPAQPNGAWPVGQRSVLITYTAPVAATPAPAPSAP